MAWAARVHVLISLELSWFFYFLIGQTHEQVKDEHGTRGLLQWRLFRWHGRREIEWSVGSELFRSLGLARVRGWRGEALEFRWWDSIVLNVCGANAGFRARRAMRKRIGNPHVNGERTDAGTSAQDR